MFNSGKSVTSQHENLQFLEHIGASCF